MTKIKIITLITLTFFTKTGMATEITCEKEGETLTLSEAQKCVEEKIIGDSEAIYKWLESHNDGKHLQGDFNKCTEIRYEKGLTPSFFNNETFKDAISQAKITSSNDGSAFCQFALEAPSLQGCYIGKDATGKVTNQVFLKIYKNSNNLSNFTPKNPG